MFAGPAAFLAITQIYPDLISGVLLTCAIVEVAIVERTGKVTRFNAAVVAISAPICRGSRFVVSFRPVTGAPTRTVVARLDAAHPTASVVIQCADSGTLFTQLDASAHSEIDVASLQLQKTA